jgi:hypothetical protein
VIPPAIPRRPQLLRAVVVATSRDAVRGWSPDPRPDRAEVVRRSSEALRATVAEGLEVAPIHGPPVDSPQGPATLSVAINRRSRDLILCRRFYRMTLVILAVVSPFVAVAIAAAVVTEWRIGGQMAADYLARREGRRS